MWVKTELRATLADLIENQAVNVFYVGNQGAFDRMVRSTLRELKTIYPQISYAVVFAYMPKNHSDFYGEDFSDSMLPDGIEHVAKRYAISWRNRWMLRKADIVVTYIRHSWGGAAQFAEMAEKQEKTIIRL